MPFNDPDPTDPNMLVGVMLPADAEATRDMAYVFAEEFARLGYSREQLLWLFKNPFYGGAHGAYRTLGEKKTLSIIDECLNVWGNVRVRVQNAQIVQNVQPPPGSSPAGAGEETDRRFEPVKPPKRLERSAAIERFERLEPETRGARK
jgi:hypothetical protein